MIRILILTLRVTGYCVLVTEEKVLFNRLILKQDDFYVERPFLREKKPNFKYQNFTLKWPKEQLINNVTQLVNKRKSKYQNLHVTKKVTRF